MGYKKIGVIVTCYNKELYIERALGSILNQESLPDSLYIVNDCSNDSSALIINNNLKRIRDRIKSVEYIDLSFNVGASNARNMALKVAQDDYLMFLDADDSYARNYIKTVRQIINTQCNVGMICSSVIMESNNHVYPSKKVYSTFSIVNGVTFVNNPLESLSIESLFIGGGNVCFRAKDALGELFDPNERNMEEWDFYYRLTRKCLENNSRIIFNNEVGYNYNNLDDNSLSRKKVYYVKEIRLPKIISDLTLYEEKKYKSFLLSIWAYNSACRLANRRLRFVFLKMNFKEIRMMQKNRYMLGFCLSLLFNDSVIKLLKNEFKKRWYK